MDELDDGYFLWLLGVLINDYDQPVSSLKHAWDHGWLETPMSEPPLVSGDNYKAKLADLVSRWKRIYLVTQGITPCSHEDIVWLSKATEDYASEETLRETLENLREVLSRLNPDIARDLYKAELSLLEGFVELLKGWKGEHPLDLY